MPEMAKRRQGDPRIPDPLSALAICPKADNRLGGEHLKTLWDAFSD